MNEGAVNYHIKADTPAIIVTCFAFAIFVISCCSHMATTSRAAALTRLVAESEAHIKSESLKCQKSLGRAPESIPHQK